MITTLKRSRKRSNKRSLNKRKIKKSVNKRSKKVKKCHIYGISPQDGVNMWVNEFFLFSNKAAREAENNVREAKHYGMFSANPYGLGV